MSVQVITASFIYVGLPCRLTRQTFSAVLSHLITGVRANFVLGGEPSKLPENFFDSPRKNWYANLQN